MSRSPLIPAKPAEITLDTLPQLFAHHRARFGGWQMSQTPPEQDPPGGGDNPPERPADIPETDWNALGDPGKRVIVREREARQAAERALAAARAKPAPPKPADAPKDADQPPAKTDDKASQPDVAAIVQQAVEAAIKPFVEREEQRETAKAAQRVQDDVLALAKPVLVDPTDALSGIDLAGVVDDQGKADPAKVKTALDDLVKRKPHLAKSTERIAPPGIGGGAPATATDAEKVKAALADMQRATGLRAASTTN